MGAVGCVTVPSALLPASATLRSCQASGEMQPALDQEAEAEPALRTSL